MSQYPGSVGSTKITCHVCGYDLSGSAVGGVCPECGTPVQQSLRPAMSSTSGESGTAMTCMILGILSIVVCGICGPIAIGLASKARREINMGLPGPSSETYVKAGLITGWIGTAIMLAQFLFFGIMFIAILAGA